MQARIWISMFSLLLAANACRGRGPGVAGQTEATARARDTATAAGDVVSMIAPPPPASTDAGILARMHEANQAEIDAAKAALAKASSPQVRSFAHDMLRENRTMDAKDTALAAATGLTPHPAASDIGGAVSPLESPHLIGVEGGPIFDMLYVDAQVIDQRTVLAMLRQFQDRARDARLKSAISGDIRVVLVRLDRAKTLQSVLNRSPAQS
jgi:predicted outer membrane protein